MQHLNACCPHMIHVATFTKAWTSTQMCKRSCIYIAKLLTCFARFQHHMLRLLAKSQHGRKLCWSSRGHGVSLKVPGWEDRIWFAPSSLSKKFPYSGYLHLHKSRFLFGIRLLYWTYFVICQCCVPVGVSGIFQQAANRNQRMNKQYASRTILEQNQSTPRKSRDTRKVPAPLTTKSHARSFTR